MGDWTYRKPYIQWFHLSGGPLPIESGALNGLIWLVRLNWGGDILSDIKLHLVMPELQLDQADREPYIKSAHLTEEALPRVQ